MAENKKYLDMPGLTYFYNQIKSKFASKTDVGTPLTASTIAAMTDQNKVYVYTGSETGHTYGDWYFYEDGAWHSGGQYRANVYETDKTLSVADKPADGKKTGDEIADLKSAFDETVGINKRQTIEFVKGRYINTGSAVEIGDTVDIANTTEWYSMKYSIVECCEGDELIIDIAGATNARAYAFLTSDNVLLSRSDANQTITGKIVAPPNAGKVIIQGIYRQDPNDTTTDEGIAHKIIQRSGVVVRYDIEQELTDDQKTQVQKNIGLISSSKVTLFTTPPNKNQILFTSEDTSIGDIFLYHIKFTTVDDVAYIALYNSQDSIIAAYGQVTYPKSEAYYNGEFVIPEGFSYAKWVTNAPNAEEFTLSKVIDGSDVPLYGNSIRYDTEQELTNEQKVLAQKNIGLIDTITETATTLFTTPPERNQIFMTTEDVSVGDKIIYHIKFTADDLGYISLHDSNDVRVGGVYGKYTYSQTGPNFDGEFVIPEGFSYAKWVTNAPNAEEFTLSKVNSEIDVPVYGNAIRYDIEQELTNEQKIIARTNIGVSSNGEIDFEEPSSTDIPMLYITGVLPTEKSQGELPVILTYSSHTKEFTSYATLKVQGDSTSQLAKKNFTIKLYKDAQRTVKDKHQFKNWSNYNKFVIKANYHDVTHARNVVGARIWSDMVKSRSDYSDLPTEMLESDNLACIDGFPIMMYANGQYFGRYAFNITKDNMLNMDDSNPDHAMVQGQGYDAGTRFEEPITTNWSDELTDDLSHVETRWKEILSFVGTSSDSDFKDDLGSYFSVPSLIDFYLFGAALFSYDSYGKNQSYLTYDGSYFICSAYDMDLTIGLHVSGHFALGATEPWLPYYGIEWTDQIGGHNSTFTYIANRLFYKLATQFSTEIKARWAELRAHGGALSFENIDKRFVEWCSLVTTEQMTEDYASTTAGGAFIGMASVDGGNADTNNIRQITKFIYDRLTYLDTVFATNS